MHNSNIIHGEYNDQEVVEVSMGDYFFYNAIKFKDKVCQIDATTGKKETYDYVLKRSVRMAINLLSTRKIEKQDVIAFCTENSCDNASSMIASCYMGAVVCSLDPTLSLENTAHLLKLTAPKIIFSDQESYKLIQESLNFAGLQSEIIEYGSEKFDLILKPAPEEHAFHPVKVGVHETAVIFFSSGSTGLPKAICHSHSTILRAMYSFFRPDFWKKFIALHFTTLYWISGMSILIRIFIDGGCRVFGNKFTAEALFKAIQDYKVTAIFLAPVYTYELTNDFNSKKYDISSLNRFLTGGTGLCVEQIERLRKLFKNAVIIFAYGMTETGCVSLFHPEKDKALMAKKRLTNTCGTIAYGVTLKIVDPHTGDVLGCNQKGEFRVKTKALMVGYHNESNVGDFDEDGFFKTGDIGYFDEDFCFYVVDRLKETFKYRSYHISPCALEAILFKHEDVVEAVVVGLPSHSPEIGALPAAAVVLKSHSTATASDIEEFVSKQVIDRDRLRGGVYLMAHIPKTPTGKPMRNVVKKMIMELL